MKRTRLQPLLSNGSQTSAPLDQTHESLHMDPKDLAQIRSKLLAQKSHILNRSHEFRQHQASSRDRLMDEADLACSQISENVSLHLLEKDRGLLFQIERALSRISLGTFGQCEGCSEPIGPRRLNVSPFSTLCLSCTEDLEDSH